MSQALNQYSCSPGSYARKAPSTSAFLGSAASSVQCVNPATGVVTTPFIANPLAGTLGWAGGSSCNWIWWVLGAILAIIIILLLIYWLAPRAGRAGCNARNFGAVDYDYR